MLADDVVFVWGVDTHADSHALVMVEANTQRSRCSLTIPATRRGYRRALRVPRRQAPGRRTWARGRARDPMGPGSPASFRSGASACSRSSGPVRDGARARLKSDALDAEWAARQVLAGTAGARSRLGAETQALRALLSTARAP
jgi:transposase